MRAAQLVAWSLLAAAVASADGVDVRWSLEPATVAPGAEVVLRAEVKIAPGEHIYGLQTPKGMPTAFELELPPGLRAAGAVAAPPTLFEEIPSVGEVEIYRGTVTFSQTLRVDANASGTLELGATLSWQMCDDANTRCTLGDSTQQLSLTVAAADGGPALGDPLGGPLGGDPLGGGSAEARVEVRAPKTTRPGTTLELEVVVHTPSGKYVYATQDSGGYDTQLELKLPGDLRAGAFSDVEEPKLEDKPGVGTIRKHYGAAAFRQVLQVGPEAEGVRTVSGTVHYMLCDETTCSLPLEAPFEVSFEVSGEAVDGAALAPEFVEDTTVDAPAPDSLFGLFFGAIGLGLLMLVQPCNYPMIPITVSIFSKGEKTSRGRSVLRAGTYGTGIVIGFLLVAGLVQVIFGAQGQDAFGKLAANPWVNIVIGALFVYFAFSFFGYYELGLPAPLMKLMQLGNAKTGSDGSVPTWSLFLMGFFFVLTSYTCGAPVVLALFSTAAADPHPLAILFATFVFAVTVALPYFVLSLVPGAVRALPKSGSWFSVLKVVLGFLELGFALKFFRGAEVNLWDGAILSREAIFGCWALICVIVGVYLSGYLPLKFPHDPALRPPTPKRLGWAALFVGGAVYFGAGVAGTRLWEPLETFVLNEGEIEGGLEHLSAEDLVEQAKLTKELAEAVIAARDAGEPLKTRADLKALGLDAEAAGRVIELAQRKIRWGTLSYTLAHSSYQEALEAAKTSGKPVFVIFTGHNCVNCQLMENTILPLPEVEEKLAPVDRVALFIDRPGDPEETKNRKLLVDTFKNATIPAFYVLDGEGKVLAEQIGGCSAEDFAAFLAKGGL